MFKNAQTKSLVRSILKIGGTAAAVYFGVTEADVATIVERLAEIGGAVAALYGVYLSYKDKKDQGE